MDTPITETNLSNRTKNALHRFGIFTVEDLVNYCVEHNITAVDSIGKVSTQEIDRLLFETYGCHIKPKRQRVKKEKPQPKTHKKHLKLNVVQLSRFKKYFDDLYGQGLEIANWHQNGELEPFDNFYESAIEYSLRKEHNK